MTNKAKKLFDFIQSYIQKNSIAPSFDEMKIFHVYFSGSDAR